jgi:hypothetical protein
MSSVVAGLACPRMRLTSGGRQALTPLAHSDAALEALHPPARGLPEPKPRPGGNDAPAGRFHKRAALTTGGLELVADGAERRLAF